MKRFGLLPAVFRCISVLSLVMALVGIAPGEAFAKTDYKTCVAECEAKVPHVEETEKNCESVIQNVAHDILVLKSYLETTKLCRAAHVEACKEWQAATVDALTRIADAIGVTPNCMTVKVGDLADNLWPFGTSKACVGDGIFTDFHDYLGGKQQVVDELSGRNLHYPLISQSIDGVLGDPELAPACMDGMRPVRQYFPSLVRMQAALKGLPDYQACMSQCRKPTRHEERLGQLPERLESAAQKLEEMKAAFQSAEAQREQQLRDQGHVPTGCVAYQRLTDFLAGADSEVAEIRRGIGAAEELGEALDEATVDGLEARVGKLEQSVGSTDLEGATKDCLAETSTAMALMARKQKVVDDLTSSREVALEASSRFGLGEEKPESCKETADCPIPYRCQNGKCHTDVDVDLAHEALLDAEKLLKQARSVELMGKDGMVERAGERLDALEVRLKEIRKDLAASGWSEAMEPWSEEFKKGHMGRLDAYQKELDVLLASMEEVDGGGKEARECRRGRRALEACLVDLQQTREALDKADPLENAKWFNLKVLDAERAIGECKAEAQEKMAACGGEGGSDGESLLWVWLLIGGLALAGGGAGTYLWIRGKRKRPKGN